MLTAVEEMLGIAGPELLSQERLGQALGELQEVIRTSEERRTERGERTAAEDFDEEEAEALEARRRPIPPPPLSAEHALTPPELPPAADASRRCQLVSTER